MTKVIVLAGAGLIGQAIARRVFDRTVDLDGVPDGYSAMNDREALKLLVRP
ncbi:MAG: hypothetical protein KYX69_21830 [Sphingomonas sp.]|uniref:hypothetical protein n=1 Tax=Sphingomonas sp. TaxID=28214 RepID=UPI002614560E|nr:hypothetical protein [Sphingomonas sp.]MDK2770348.1 hypothetical protein [Sphingomonas sp.]